MGIPDIDLKSIKGTDSPRSIKITKTANNFLFYQHPAIHYKLYLFYSKLKIDIKSTFYYKRSLGMFDNSYTCTIYICTLCCIGDLVFMQENTSIWVKVTLRKSILIYNWINLIIIENLNN